MLIESRITYARRRYGPYASSHEALGVITEEYQELVQAIRSNNIQDIAKEAQDLAACATKLARDCGGKAFRARSVK